MNDGFKHWFGASIKLYKVEHSDYRLTRLTCIIFTPPSFRNQPEMPICILVLPESLKRKRCFTLPTGECVSLCLWRERLQQPCLQIKSFSHVQLHESWPVCSSPDGVVSANIILAVSSDSKQLCKCLGEIMDIHIVRFVTSMHIRLCPFNEEPIRHVPWKWLVM